MFGNQRKDAETLPQAFRGSKNPPNSRLAANKASDS
jgi:hypothetical protein